MAERIGIAGLGKMGTAIGARLADEGWSVSGWTRGGRRPDGSTIAMCDDLKALVKASDILILSLFDDSAVADVVAELCRADLAGRLIVDTSTVSPATLKDLVSAIVAAGGAAIDAPIAGGPPLVASGAAGTYIGGDQRNFDRFLPVARSYSSRVIHVGRLGAGATAKLVNNAMVISYWQCLKEAMRFGRREGLDPQIMMEVLAQSPAATRALIERIPVIAGDSDAVGFTVAGVVKDSSLIVEAGRQAGIDMRVMSLALESFRTFRDAGNGEADVAAMLQSAYRGD